MLTAALIVAALLSSSGQVTVIARTPAPAEVRSTAPAEAETGTRRVCRLERATGSNLQQRVCRTIRVAAPQSQQTREFLNNLQRVPIPDGP